MNDNCNWKTTFACMVAIDGFLVINHYDLTIHFSVKDPEPTLQNIAFDRIKFWVNNVLGNSIVLCDENPKYPLLKELHQNNFVELPVDPADYYFVQAIWCKLNKITNGIIDVSLIELTSDLSDGVCFGADGLEVSVLDREGHPKNKCWWNSETPKTNLQQDYIPWKQFGLDYAQESLTKSKKSARIIKVKNFNPTLVKNNSEN